MSASSKLRSFANNRGMSLRALAGLSIDLRVLVLSVAAFAVLCAYRFYDYWVTGFFISDEFGYYYDAVHTQIYSDRWFFGWLNIYLFRALGITNVDAFSYLLPFYMFFWAAVTMVVFYKTVRLLGFDERTTAISVLSSFALVSFVLLSLGFLTEPVGLCLAMIGIYCLIRGAKARTIKGLLGFPFFAAAAFGAASGTREPYEALLMGGALVVAFAAVSRRKEILGSGKLGTKPLLSLSLLIFIVSAVFFLTVPAQSFSTQVAPISSQLAQTLITNPATTPVTTTTVTNTTVYTSTTTVVETYTTLNKTVTTTSTEVVTATSTSTSVSVPSVPFYRHSLLLNTVLIFVGGIVLGWGPICFVIGVAGFLILLRAVRRGSLETRSLFLISLIALGSYFVVSFIFAPDPFYFSFSNYSTIIRFSDTALPAFFIMAPFFLVRVTKSRKRMLTLLSVLVIFLLVAVPIYEIYAASNIHYTSENPFQLGYRSDAVLMRNYFQQAQGEGTLNLVGEPYGWAFTPGVQDLHINSYAIGASPLFPELFVANFTSFRWGSFFLYLPNTEQAPSNSSALLDLIAQSQAKHPALSSSFNVVSAQLVLAGGDFELYEVGLEWY